VHNLGMYTMYAKATCHLQGNDEALDVGHMYMTHCLVYFM